MKLKSAKAIHEETLLAKVAVWDEFRTAVAEQIDVAKSRGHFLVRLKIPCDIQQPEPMVDELRALGYGANLAKDSNGNNSIAASWRNVK